MLRFPRRRDGSALSTRTGATGRGRAIGRQIGNDNHGEPRFLMILNAKAETAVDPAAGGFPERRLACGDRHGDGGRLLHDPHLGLPVRRIPACRKAGRSSLAGNTAQFLPAEDAGCTTTAVVACSATLAGSCRPTATILPGPRVPTSAAAAEAVLSAMGSTTVLERRDRRRWRGWRHGRRADPAGDCGGASGLRCRYGLAPA